MIDDQRGGDLGVYCLRYSPPNVMEQKPHKYPESSGDDTRRVGSQQLEAGNAHQAEPLHPGQIVAGRYRIVEKLGQGGMGVVYRAEQIFLHRDCALKTMNKGIVSPVAWRRFQKEAKMATMLDHPGLIKVHDFGFVDETQEQPFFAMDLVEGATLQELLRQGLLPLNAVLVIFPQICLAIGHAHVRDVMHRDIKPSNIVISGSIHDKHH
jgi:serine/threonine protein kinase